MTRGLPVAVACSMARVSFSPTTEPIEPIMKVRSRQATTAGRPLMKISPQDTFVERHSGRLRADALGLALFDLFACEPLRVGLKVPELERVARAESGEEFDEGVLVGELVDPLGRRDAEVVIALGAAVEVGLHLSPVDHLAAPRASEPQALGDRALASARFHIGPIP